MKAYIIASLAGTLLAPALSVLAQTANKAEAFALVDKAGSGHPEKRHQ